MKCTCGGEMAAGFIPDFGHFATWVGCWLPGTPDTNKSMLDRMKTGAGVALDMKEARMLEAHRCDNCGMVQLYARQPVPTGFAPT
ncbi:MAG: hypothetical protein AB1758_18895 [Candidatus Eremiobacterota bacterium]